MPPRLPIEGLHWTREDEEHVEQHIDTWAIEELIEGRDFYAFPNKGGHPPNRWRMIGRIPGGAFVTVILEEPADGDPTHWRPVTGWRSAPFERELYQQERKRIATKRGWKYGQEDAGGECECTCSRAEPSGVGRARLGA